MARLQRSPEIRVSIDQSRNMIQITFPFKPPEDILKHLKERKFRYNPKSRIWEKPFSTSALIETKLILSKII